MKMGCASVWLKGQKLSDLGIEGKRLYNLASNRGQATAGRSA